MEASDGSNDVVHPEVRAHINSLVSALGGFSADDDGRYKLGDDALEVLRDMKKWIRFYDEKTNRMDVARCLSEANVVGGDLLQILATWPEAQSDSKFKARVALACYEIMTPLTWPIEKDPERTTVNHYRHMPVLQLAQLGYKRDIINFDGAQILHTAIRVALPSMAVPIGDRTPRDQGIIKLVLYFLRNIAMIAPPPGLKYDGDESQISRSATIDAFSYQDIFLAILTIASNMGEDFRTEDVIIMEIIFHLVKRVDIRKLFLDGEALSKAKGEDLVALIKKEKSMLRAQNKRAPTRHNRFGTMVWVQRADGRMSAISGQDALRDSATRERKMDDSKTFRPPRRSRKAEMEPKDLGSPVSLNERANKQLRGFVEEFLDSGFNPLFQHIRKTIDREAPYLLHQHRAQFFYLTAWFLQAERERIKTAKNQGSSTTQDDVSPFNLVAGVLNQEMFITLSRAMDRAYNDKDWPELTTVMRCFSQILLTVQDMADSGDEENEDIAENILNRLFYEEATHDAIANIARNFKDQGFEYLDACTELIHTYLRILESYSKQNVDMQVRSRKRTRKNKKAAKATGEDGDPVDDTRIDDGDDSANDEASAERTSRERKFDFGRFAMRFVPQGVVDTFVQFTKYYRDLDDSQLKRAHRYFFRVAFKQDMSVMLFRVDIIHLLYNMIKGPEALDKSSSMFKDWEELVKQIIRKCVRKIEDRPALIIEMLFSKINSTAHYLEFGFEKQTISGSANPRPGAELEFKKQDLNLEQQIAIAVGVLLDKNQADHLTWVKNVLSNAEVERRAWETAQDALPSVESQNVEGDIENEAPAASSIPQDSTPTIVRPDHDGRRGAMFKNPHLRLLMRLVGFERLAPSEAETPESAWIIPANLRADQLQEAVGHINAAEFNPPVFDDDKSAEDQLRRKSAGTTSRRKKAAFDDDEENDVDNEDDDGLEEFLFEPGGPTARKSDVRPKKKLTRRKRSPGQELTDEQQDEKARLRREKDLEKQRKIKSAARVHSSDEESDQEADAAFFAREKERMAARNALYSRLARNPGEFAAEKAAGKTTKVPVLLSDESGGEDSVAAAERSKRRKRKSESVAGDEDDRDGGSDGGSEDAGTPARDAPETKPLPKRRKKATAFVVSSDEEDSGDEAPANTRGQSSQRSAAEDAMETDETPLSSSPHKTKTTDVEMANDDDHDEEDTPVKAPTQRRPGAKAGFVLDSSDEE
ncbi:Topoisomerase 1-associated factor 1 [Pyricularia oryzae]|nr:Topoisomerase 1-associated factor 1 [Pyricularia oryzae]KAI6406351.1 Topoisomerase 1-associated factor 1 [Pyricularia oryzae]KAI6428139.1 Topoisomerase 1-associated factor 1 [Pyricularia oryzae]KAI6431200.1 Topoisomerase 1-associated factor 1 [Pyricularia oryzae]KAI6552994.1 Topoisomerase 1-associated factor 1 [Pyricularia oryzae]